MTKLRRTIPSAESQVFRTHTISILAAGLTLLFAVGCDTAEQAGSTAPVQPGAVEATPESLHQVEASVEAAVEGAVCGGIAGIPCDAGETCVLDEGQCNVSDAQGTCVTKPDGCFALYDRVCGCDGKTYGNKCDAILAGAQIDHDGACEAGCQSDAQCGPNQYCHYASCNADAGQCATKPLICPRVWDPVCGCNGKTYANECYLKKAGVTWAYDGKCDPTCGGIAGIPCPNGQVCIFPPGSCNISDAQGKCAIPPQACPLVYDPVCGCDGETYANKCFALAAGASIDHNGPCIPPTCESNEECPDGMLCRKKTGLCEDGIGKCVDPPQACPLYFLPVCGCDGMTYPNRCLAAAALVNVASNGPCPCGPEPVCDADQLPADSDGDGCNDTCACAFAIDCLPGYVPVDTNDNGCADACAAACQDACDCYDADLAFQDECPLLCANCGNYWACEGGACTEQCGFIPPEIQQCFPTPCTSNNECAKTDYCAKGAGDCGGAGECAPKPEACLAVYDPVCGCDGKTYSNGCVAAASGVNVAHEDACLCPPEPVCDFDQQAIDTTGDGCPDTCECAIAIDCLPGNVPVDTNGNGCADSCAAACQDACDCYDADVPFPEPCLALCPTCDNYWVCKGGACLDKCGPVPPEIQECFPTGCNANDECAAGEYCAKDAGACDGDGECAAKPDICLAIFAPVCGCDGQTYSNACVAAANGENVAYEGECQSAGCATNADCAANEYCQFPGGQCSAPGDCTLKPDLCPAIYDPVCGCDGQTYSNSCVAAAAGMSVAHQGQCAPQPDCESNADCAAGEYCQLDVGVCGGAGFCEPKPDACLAIYDPVCGCDGNTYSNACYAAASGTNVAHEGECSNSDCNSNADCAKSEYCQLPATNCGGSGVCKTKPELCPAVFAPVCGCDGQTYSNACVAAANGANIAHEGECQSAGCTSNAQCPTGSYCAKPAGQCSAAGQCAPKPEACIALFAPVCGCDGQTYSNSCVAAASGVPVASVGACQ